MLEHPVVSFPAPSFFVYDIFIKKKKNAKDTLNSAKTLANTKHVDMITYSTNNYYNS